ncbi:centrosomal protein of 135 kDa [Copidosoma floridanum]|uniref:centrosomal protein of 135 kDa n=1 Tax=Copidosoma floridanum TaxID=29053 RepID=UPI000C6F92CC|nr:centrosomal protein of 135 kDa [Copidosoma floridanum]
MSNNNDDYSIAGRYRTVRKHLDDLGYRQALSLDSLPLIELLLVDLAQTRESLKHFQCLAKENLQTCNELQSAVDPYKCDNAKLVQECNETHLKLLEAREALVKQSNEHKKKVRKLESELSDLQMSYSKNFERIKMLEKESANKSKRISELMGRYTKPITKNPSLATKKRPTFPLKKSDRETDFFSEKLAFNKKNVEPCVVDFIDMADRRIRTLTNEISKLKEESFLSNEYSETLKLQLDARNKEICRLRKLLEGGRPCTSISQDHCLLTSNKRCLEAKELEELQEAKLKLEQQLRESLTKQHEAMAQAVKLAERNEELERELRDIDRQALAREADCNSTVKHNNKRVCKLQEKLDNVMTRVHTLQNELTMQRREAQELRADLEACRLEKSSVQRLLENTLEEKKHMTDRINNLTMMASKSTEKSSSHEHSSNKNECHCHRGSRDNISHSNFEVIHDKNVMIESLRNNIEKLELERDFYKSEYVKIKDQFRKDFEKDSDNMWSQICELREKMSEKEHAISKLLREKKDLCREKFDLENKLQTQQVTSSTYPCPCRRSLLIDDRSINLSSKVEKLELEKDKLRADVERLIEERNSLRERLQLATKAHVAEHRQLRDKLDEMELRLARTERERRELLIAQEGRRAAISGLDDQLEDLREELKRTKLELTEQRTQYFQLRSLQDQTDQALGDVQRQLTDCENELTSALDRNKCLERQQLQLENEIKELRQEINNHRSRMAQMDREKDQLLMDLDERTEKIAALERELAFKEQQASSMEQQIRDLSHTKQACADQATDMDRQMRSMQLEVENLHRQLATLNIDRDNAIQENRRLQDDLAAVSCEVRKMHKELETSRAEALDLKRQLQTYVTEVRRAEDLLAQKENERTDMLNHYRSLSLEATVLENNNHSLETEAAEARGALQSARDQMADFERQLSNKDCLVKGYEAQITELTQNIASLEIQLQQATDQRSRAEDDLRTVRDLCVTLEQQKECITHRLEDSEDKKNQYEIQLERYRSEQDVFQDQLTRDHKTIDRLERLIEEARKETMISQANNRELQSEVARLKAKISDLQCKLSSETAEVRKYQTQAAEYSKQITELRRQVANERFEKSRREETRSRRTYDDDRRAIGPIAKSHSNMYSLTCRYGTAVVPAKLESRPCSACDRFKVRVVSPSSNVVTPETSTTDENNNCVSGDYQEVTSRACFCSGKVGYVAAKTKKLKDMENNNLNQQSSNVARAKSAMYSDTKCLRCGGRRKKKLQSLYPGSSTYWLAETLNLMNKILEEKTTNSPSRRGTVNSVRISRASHDIPGNSRTAIVQARKDANASAKRHEINFNSIGSISTQTLDDTTVISHLSQPQLLKILAEIQQYTKSIQEYFCLMNETLKQQDGSKSVTTAQPEAVQCQETAVTRTSTVTETSERVSKESFGDQPENERNRVKEDEAYRSISMESMIQMNCSADDWEAAPIASTPRQSDALRSIARPTDKSETFKDLEDVEMNPDDLYSVRSQESLEHSFPESSNIDNSTEYMELPQMKRATSDDGQVAEPEDSTQYKMLPERIMPEKNILDDIDGDIAIDRNKSKVSSNVVQQVNDVYEEMETIKQKIENLRMEVLKDFEPDKNRDS